MPSATYTHRATTRHDRRFVWQRLQKPDTWKAMGGIEQITDPRIGDDGTLEGFDFTTTVGGVTYRGVATTSAATDPEEMVVDIETSELGARLRVDLADHATDGTALDVAMELRSTSFLASMMWGLISSTVGSGLGDRVEEVVASFDA